MADAGQSRRTANDSPAGAFFESRSVPEMSVRRAEGYKGYAYGGFEPHSAEWIDLAPTRPRLDARPPPGRAAAGCPPREFDSTMSKSLPELPVRLAEVYEVYDYVTARAGFRGRNQVRFTSFPVGRQPIVFASPGPETLIQFHSG
jgi:hypothetical protein